MTRPLTIIVVSYNTRERTERCITHLFDYTDEPFHLVVVDNASSDGTPEMLADYARRLPHDVTVVQNSQNLGYAPAVGQACSRKWTEGDVCLVNSDLYVGPEWAGRLQSHLYRDGRIAAVAPLGRGIGGRQDFSLYYQEWCQKASIRDYLIDVNHRLTGARPCATTAKCLQGTIWMIKGQALRQLGGLDPGCLAGADDADWCLRARIGGWKLVIAMDVFVWHDDHSSFAELPGQGALWINQSWDYFNHKWHGQFDRLSWADLMENTAVTEHPPFVYEEFSQEFIGEPGATTDD